MDRKCPKCNKDYSTNINWKAELTRHLARKNPCNRDPNTKYIKDKTIELPQKIIHPLDSIEMTNVIVPDISMKKIGPWFFNQFVNNKSNICFVKPNSSKNEIWVKVSNNQLRIVTIDEFIQLFVNLVMVKWFPEHGDFESWIYDDLSYEFDQRIPWNGQYKNTYTHFKTYKYKGTVKEEYVETSTFYIEMKREILGFMHSQKERTILKNLLSLNINENVT